MWNGEKANRIKNYFKRCIMFKDGLYSFVNYSDSFNDCSAPLSCQMIFVLDQSDEWIKDVVLKDSYNFLMLNEVFIE